MKVEQKYLAIEKLCLVLFFSCSKLRYYLFPTTVNVVCQTDVIKYMLMRPISRGRIGKWTLALTKFALQYVPQKAVKGQALADFLTDHPPMEVARDMMEVPLVGLTPWKLFFDGFKIEQAVGAGVILRSPEGIETQVAFRLDFSCSNNQAEYEALILGMGLLLDLKADIVEIIGGSQLDVVVRHIPRSKNQAANGLAQAVFGIGLPEGSLEKTIVIKRKTQSAIHEASYLEVNHVEDMQLDWQTPIIQYLSNPRPKFDKRIKDKATGYVLIGEDLYKKGKDDLLLKCVSLNEATLVMAKVHEGICGAHQAGPKMRWLIRRHGYYWPTMTTDYVKYAKGCWACQTHGPVQRLPTTEFNPVVKPWPFRGWAMDLIGKITPSATRGHCFIIVATDYFTKWVEAVPMKGVSQAEVIQFLKSHIIHRFGLPETVKCDNGSVFVGDEVVAFAAELGITFTHSTSYYVQGNGQAEASNKILKGCLAKVVDDNP
ncbi:uncharacterized protein LOC122650587 [Telopea speciosissima]|uniref:uncharacterized protein LOC122650587 n=1 Tax=Telopea speciosissima TaxID=54955 RepID=UPI001CC3D2E8|nr:uncharacterized protein LOC122650587 [Telopea speciosissima]